MEAETRGGDATARLLVIGWGSLIHSDDAVGRRVAEEVAGWMIPGVTALSVPQLTPELAEPLSRAPSAVFVDARTPDADPSVDLRPVRPVASAVWSAHASSPEGLLGLCLALYGRRPESWLVTVPTADVSLGEALTPTAERGLAESLVVLRHLLETPGPSPAGPADCRGATDRVG